MREQKRIPFHHSIVPSFHHPIVPSNDAVAHKRSRAFDVQRARRMARGDEQQKSSNDRDARVRERKRPRHHRWVASKFTNHRPAFVIDRARSSRAHERVRVDRAPANARTTTNEERSSAEATAETSGERRGASFARVGERERGRRGERSGGMSRRARRRRTTATDDRGNE